MIPSCLAASAKLKAIPMKSRNVQSTPVLSVCESNVPETTSTANPNSMTQALSSP
ncbi:hypothetical protein D3C73_1609060 [compost metagenome]